MTPIPASLSSPHLTEEQFGDLLTQSVAPAAQTPASAQAHLLDCEQCAAELATMRQSLSLFRDANAAYADTLLRSMRPIKLPTRRHFALQPAYWATAAAALFLAAILPMQMLHRHSALPERPVTATIAAAVPDSPVESDEALLEDVNREISASVPTPMQALADPTATSTTTSSSQTSTQRKD
jgi:anti-sigma factor RsiW